jgi:hypothetical protein
MGKKSFQKSKKGGKAFLTFPQMMGKIKYNINSFPLY